MRNADPRLVPGPNGLTTRRLLALLLLGCALGVVFGSRPLATWSAKLPPGPVPDAIAWWDAAMDHAGLTSPYDTIHARIRDWSG